MGESMYWCSDHQQHETSPHVPLDPVRRERDELRTEVERLRGMAQEMQGDLDADPDRQKWPRITVRRWLRWVDVEQADPLDSDKS